MSIFPDWLGQQTGGGTVTVYADHFDIDLDETDLTIDLDAEALTVEIGQDSIEIELED